MGSAVACPQLPNDTPVALEGVWFYTRRAPKLQPAQLGDSMHLYYKTVCNLWVSRV